MPSIFQPTQQRVDRAGHEKTDGSDRSINARYPIAFRI
jgi:hypothetical protein